MVTTVPSEVCSVVCCSLQSHGLTRPCPWNFPGKSTGVSSHFLLQGIFLTQGSNPGPLHSRQILYCLSHQGTHLEGGKGQGKKKGGSSFGLSILDTDFCVYVSHYILIHPCSFSFFLNPLRLNSQSLYVL